ncbi:hypothetical protein D3C77_396710 [compost metagenome]
MTCALVPPIPKELTPARKGCAPRSHFVSSLFTINGLSEKLILGFGVSKWRLGGICLYRKARAVLIKPATPAAASRCPILVFTDPIRQNPFLLVWNALVKASISMGSPSVVPEPCAST